MFNKKMIILLFVALVVIAGILIVLLAYPFSKEVKVSKEAFILTTDGSLESSTTINISGTLYTPMSKVPYFEGTIEVQGLDFTVNNPVITLVEEKAKGLNFSTFFYGQTFDKGNGLMFFKDDFTEINLFMRDIMISNNKTDFIQVVAPASDEKSAQVVLKHLHELYPNMPTPRDLDVLRAK